MLIKYQSENIQLTMLNMEQLNTINSRLIRKKYLKDKMKEVEKAKDLDDIKKILIEILTLIK